MSVHLFSASVVSWLWSERTGEGEGRQDGAGEVRKRVIAIQLRSAIERRGIHNRTNGNRGGEREKSEKRERKKREKEQRERGGGERAIE